MSVQIYSSPVHNPISISLTNREFHPLPLMETSRSSIQTHDELLRNELLIFYENKEYLRKMSGIINGKRLSLRLLDWFVCNYSKEYYTMYEIQRGEKNIRFKVYPDYKTNLDIYSKKRFAPFCRHERMYVSYDDDNLMETTLGQLNFFRWVFKNYILEFMEANYEDIKRDMDARNTSRKRRTSSDKSSSSMDSVSSSSVSKMDNGKKGEMDSLSVSMDSPPFSSPSLTDKSSEHLKIPSSLNGIGSCGGGGGSKTRKKREELSSSACRSMRFERNIPITMRFGDGQGNV